MTGRPGSSCSTRSRQRPSPGLSNQEHRGKPGAGPARGAPAVTFPQRAGTAASSGREGSRTVPGSSPALGHSLVPRVTPAAPLACISVPLSAAPGDRQTCLGRGDRRPTHGSPARPLQREDSVVLCLFRANQASKVERVESFSSST